MGPKQRSALETVEHVRDLGAIDLDMIVDFARLRTAGDFVGRQATTTSFEEIPEAIVRLKNGDVLGRIVAIME